MGQHAKNFSLQDKPPHSSICYMRASTASTATHFRRFAGFCFAKWPVGCDIRREQLPGSRERPPTDAQRVVYVKVEKEILYVYLGERVTLSYTSNEVCHTRVRDEVNLELTVVLKRT